MAGGSEGAYLFTPGLVGALCDTCEMVRGKRSGYPHLCGQSHPCGKNDDPATFLRMARDHATVPGAKPVSAAYSSPKAGFILELVAAFKSGRVSAAKVPPHISRISPHLPASPRISPHLRCQRESITNPDPITQTLTLTLALALALS